MNYFKRTFFENDAAHRLLAGVSTEDVFIEDELLQLTDCQVPMFRREPGGIRMRCVRLNEVPEMLEAGFTAEAREVL